MENKYEQAFDKAGWTLLDESDREWWTDNLLRKIPSEDPVRLLKAVGAVEDESDWRFDSVDEDFAMTFDKAGDAAAVFVFDSLGELEEYVAKNFSKPGSNGRKPDDREMKSVVSA